MRPFAYAHAESREEALARVAQGARPLAGGTDLLTLMKADVVHPEELVDIKRLPGMTDLSVDTAGRMRIGALVTLADLETSAEVRAHLPMLAEAAAVAATLQLRNMATIGGNLLQRPRCWYYREPRIDCWLKGGETCPARNGQNQHHAILGGDPCYAVHPSDLAPVLLAADAEIALTGAGGDRVLPVRDFFTAPEDGRRRETVLRDDELVTGIEVPVAPAASGEAFLKTMSRQAWSFALVSVAARVHIEGERIVDARLALGGVAPIPWRADSAESELLGARPDGDAFGRAADAALRDARPLEHNGYKLPLARRLVIQALTEAAAAVPHGAA